MMQRSKVLLLVGALLLIFAANSPAAEKQKTKPYPHYWLSVATSSQNTPGMSPEMAGMASMFGGGIGGPRRDLILQLESPQSVTASPEAFHDIPPGQNMGKSLPLTTPKSERAQPRERDYTQPDKREKGKVRMLYYWGCGDTIGAGQPRVFDSEKTKVSDMSSVFKGRTPTVQTPPSPHKGWTYGEWPYADERTNIPKDASLVGEHRIHGNYTVDIPFSLDVKRDFMPPVEFSSVQTTAAGATKLEWKKIPTSIGYFATAIGSDGKSGDTVMWSASEVPENGLALMDYLTPGDVQRFIKDKVVMDTSRTSCTIPPIFKNSQGAMLQFIAYGEQLDLVHPPKPKDPKQIWQPEWSVKVRLKSTAMTPLGIETGDGDGREKPTSRKSRSKSRLDQNDTAEQSPDSDSSGSKKSKERGMGDAIRGIFGF